MLVALSPGKAQPRRGEGNEERRVSSKHGEDQHRFLAAEMATDGAEIDLYAEDLEHEFNQVRVEIDGADERIRLRLQCQPGFAIKP